MAKKKIKEIIEEIAAGFMEESELELYNVEFAKEGRDWFLRVYADKIQEGAEESYISTEDCERISRFLSEKLDKVDPIPQNYYLEVSSPGMDRELLKEEHYRRYRGRQVEVRLYQPIDGKKQIEGTLEDLKEDRIIVIDENKQSWELPLAQVAKTKLAVVF